MSMPVLALPPPLRNGDRLTREEFLRRWEAMPEVKHAELIGGIVRMASPVSAFHKDFQFSMNVWLGSYIPATPGCGGGANGTWLMAPNEVPQPDLDFRILPEYGGQSRVEGAYAAGAPDLVIEVSQTTSVKDAGAKLRLYESCGVREYLIVRPERRQAAWRELFEGKYREIAPDKDGVLRSRVFPGLWLDTEALWDSDFARLQATVQRGLATAGHREFVERLQRAKR